MKYDEPLYRPPSEARSTILQVTLGCSWNRCLFCGMYKSKTFAVRPFEDFAADVREMAKIKPQTTRIFLADGDALTLDTDYLVKVLELLNEAFPKVERISSYAGPTNLARKTVAELRTLKDLKLERLYIGLETGDDELLKRIHKGTDSIGFAEGCIKAKDAGMLLSTILLLGIGGVEGSYQHAKASARMVNAIDPQYLACLTLMLGPYQQMYENDIMGGGFRLPDQLGTLKELRWLVEDLKLSNCRFGTEHASNYLPISGTLPDDQAKILDLIDKACVDKGLLRSEWQRGL